jgi:hypothetical protein
MDKTPSCEVWLKLRALLTKCKSQLRVSLDQPVATRACETMSVG